MHYPFHNRQKWFLYWKNAPDELHLGILCEAMVSNC